MTGRQNDKLTMLLLVMSFLKNTDAATLAKMPNIVALIQEFDEMLQALSKLHQIQGLDRTGIRIKKLRMRGELTALTLNVASAIEVYAIAINDVVLQQEVCLKEYQLNKYRETTLADTSRFIHKKAVSLLAVLAEYNVTPEMLTELQEATDEYDAIVPKTRAGIVAKATSTTQIKELFEKIDKMLFRLDKLVNLLRYSNKMYYEGYYSSRKIIRRGIRKNALQGTIQDENGIPLSKVTIAVATHTNVVTQSGEKGHYLFRRLPGGVWPVTFSRLGYVSETVYLAVIPLLRQELNVVLKKQLLEEKQA